MTDWPDWKQQKKIRPMIRERLAEEICALLEIEISVSPGDTYFNKQRRSVINQIKEQRGISDEK